jgi:hypothetical protein
MEERHANQRFIERENFCIVAYTNYFRDLETKKFIGGGAKSIIERSKISHTKLDKLLHEYDQKMTNGTVFQNLTPNSHAICEPDSGLTDIIRQNDLIYII